MGNAPLLEACLVLDLLQRRKGILLDSFQFSQHRYLRSYSVLRDAYCVVRIAWYVFRDFPKSQSELALVAGKTKTRPIKGTG
jgi:hypothetical protein